MWISQSRLLSSTVSLGSITAAALSLVLHAQSVVCEEEGVGFEDSEAFEPVGIDS